jgi:glutathione S-transferase
VKYFDSLGPNPRLVRQFLIEKDLELPTEQIDMMGGANRKRPFIDKNPAGQVPALELDNGAVISETFVICDYLEDKHPNPPLIGRNAEEKAETRMWTRRIDLAITGPLTDGFRYGEGLALFKDRIHTIPAAANDLKAIARDRLAWLDGLIAGKQWICGDRFTLADITLYCFLDFGGTVGQPFDRSLKNISAWFDRAAARPSAEASIHPGSVPAKLRA